MPKGIDEVQIYVQVAAHLFHTTDVPELSKVLKSGGLIGTQYISNGMFTGHIKTEVGEFERQLNHKFPNWGFVVTNERIPKPLGSM